MNEAAWRTVACLRPTGRQVSIEICGFTSGQEAAHVRVRRLTAKRAVPVARHHVPRRFPGENARQNPPIVQGALVFREFHPRGDYFVYGRGRFYQIEVKVLVPGR